jgi:hypothetical protein
MSGLLLGFVVSAVMFLAFGMGVWKGFVDESAKLMQFCTQLQQHH